MGWMLQLRLSVLNSTKTAYSAFAFDSEGFFETYSFSLGTISSAGRSNRFCCQVYIKVGISFIPSCVTMLRVHQALLSVFKGRTSDKDKDTAVERCEVEIHEDAQQTECRLVIRMICGLGTYYMFSMPFYMLINFLRSDQILQAYLRACPCSTCGI